MLFKSNGVENGKAITYNGLSVKEYAWRKIMKKFLSVGLTAAMAVSLAACGSSSSSSSSCAKSTSSASSADMAVAMITDYGDITDQSFNQTTYEACKAWAADNDVKFNYYKPASDADADREASIV